MFKNPPSKSQSFKELQRWKDRKKKSKKSKEKKKMSRADYTKLYPHRIVWEKEFGLIPAGFHVHHINCDHEDNRLENLVALPDWYHAQIHRDMRINPTLSSKYTRAFLLDKYVTFKDIYHRHELLLDAVEKCLEDSLKPFKDDAIVKGRSEKKKLKKSEKNYVLSPDVQAEFDRFRNEILTLSERVAIFNEAHRSN